MVFKSLICKTILIFLTWIAGIHSASAQIDCPTDAGVFCDPGLPNGAPLLCDLACLDGFVARMPSMDSVLLVDQPTRLCPTGMQGDANNLSWFAFVAGSTTIQLRITPSNCTVEGNNLEGVQAGIYSRCYTWDVVEDYCMGDCTNSAFNIGGPGFTPGETYFFFIDGCNGSVCDYSVQVLTGNQAFPLPNIDSLIIDANNDTLCTNESVTIRTSGLTQDSIEYFYSITPFTSDYPDGRHPDILSPVTDWVFSQPGDYTICVEATNGCDITPQYCRQVFVRDIDSEIFTTVDVCMEDLPAYRGPQVEDPNGDGVIGWQAGSIFRPGLNRDTVFLPNGCSYVQEITINTITLNPRENVLLTLCESDFPFNYLGEMITDTFSNRFITLDNQADSGCDSLVQLSVRRLIYNGEILLGRCDSGQGVLTLQEVIPPRFPYPNFTVSWLDPNDNILPPLNGNPFEVSPTISGTYHAIVDFTPDGFSCIDTVFSSFIDLNNFVPSSPVVVEADSILCQDSLTAFYRVLSASDPSDVFDWMVPSGTQIISQNQDSLLLNWLDIAGGEICVTLSNSCGMSPTTCFTVERRPVPVPGIITDTLTCLGDTTTFSFSGDPSWSFSWEIFNGTRVSQTDSNSIGPHQVIFQQSSQPTGLLFFANDGFCSSDAVSRPIEILDQLSIPSVNCSATENSVVFLWDTISGAIAYDIQVLSGHNGILQGTSYTVNGLAEDEEVTILISSLAQNSCADSDTMRFTCIAGCNPIQLEISASDQFLCRGIGQSNLTIVTDRNPSDVTITGTGVVDDVFEAGNLSPGNYNIIASYSENGCVYQDSISIEIGALPSYTIDVQDPICPEDERGILTFTSIEGSLMVNGNPISEDTVSLSVGQHSIQVLAPNGCSAEESIFVNAPIPLEINISATASAVVGDLVDFTIPLTSTERDRISDISWYDGNGLSLCGGDDTECDSINVVVEDDALICVDVTYDQDCIVTSCVNLNAVRIINIFAPTVFSPNQDGHNDQFLFHSNERDLIVNKFAIFNRWGELMHLRNNTTLEAGNVGWDGMYKGTKASEGVYVYYLEYQEEGRVKVKKGDVLLLR